MTGSRELVWATSWGVSTRLIGAMVMSHSDDKGTYLHTYLQMCMCRCMYECMFVCVCVRTIRTFHVFTVFVLVKIPSRSTSFYLSLDNQLTPRIGLVLPPPVAPVQVVIVPITNGIHTYYYFLRFIIVVVFSFSF